MITDKKDVVRMYTYIYTCIYVYIHTHRETQKHTMEYYSAMKKNEIMPLAVKWLDLKNITLREVNHRQIYIIYMWNLKK